MLDGDQSRRPAAVETPAMQRSPGQAEKAERVQEPEEQAQSRLLHSACEGSDWVANPSFNKVQGKDRKQLIQEEI